MQPCHFPLLLETDQCNHVTFHYFWRQTSTTMSLSIAPGDRPVQPHHISMLLETDQSNHVTFHCSLRQTSPSMSHFIALRLWIHYRCCIITADGPTSGSSRIRALHPKYRAQRLKDEEPLVHSELHHDYGVAQRHDCRVAQPYIYPVAQPQAECISLASLAMVHIYYKSGAVTHTCCMVRL